MNEDTSALSITVGPQTFRVRTKADQAEELRKAEALAAKALEDVLSSGVVPGPKALAMTAFQLAVELQEARDKLNRQTEGSRRLGDLIDRINQVTDKGPKA